MIVVTEQQRQKIRYDLERNIADAIHRAGLLRHIWNVVSLIERIADEIIAAAEEEAS